MKVLITGGAGFIGSTLAEHLHAAGNAVTVLDNLSTGRLENLNALKGAFRFSFVEGSTADAATLDPLTAACDVCVHLASPVGVKYVMERPVETILDNIRSIDVLMASAHRHGKKVLLASTSEVYGRHLDLLDPTHEKRLKEGDYRIEGATTNHRWAYANNKALNEFLALAYHKAYGLPVVILRFFNIVGPRQVGRYGMVIPNFVRQALAGEDLVVFGAGEQRRSFLHVQDAVRAVAALLDEEAAVGGVFNVGNPDEITINELGATIVNLTGSASRIRHISYEEAYGKGFEDMQRRTPDISRIEELIDFRITYTLEDTLRDIIAYHRATASY